MLGEKKEIERMAVKYNLQIIFAFGSRAKEVLEVIEGRMARLSPIASDLDIGVKPEDPLSVQKKVEIAIFFEDLFDLPRVDVVVLPEAPVSLAAQIVTGEILYARDPNYEAEYQLNMMRMAADLLPYEREKQKMILGVEP
jgi:predicted nucleotidyltransferase